MGWLQTGVAWGPPTAYSGIAQSQVLNLPAHLPQWPGGTVPPIPVQPAPAPVPGPDHAQQSFGTPFPEAAPRITPLGLGILAGMALVAFGLANARRRQECY